MPGQEGAQICRNISIIDDQLCEFQENFGIVLSSNDPAVNIQNSPGSANIVDNDGKITNYDAVTVKIVITETMQIKNFYSVLKFIS